MKNDSLIPQPIANHTLMPKLSHALTHQRLAHLGDYHLDDMSQIAILGLPKIPFPRKPYSCPICTAGKFAHPSKGSTVDTSSLIKGKFLHMDFAFWNEASHLNFTSMLTIVDTETHMLWFSALH